MAIIARPRLNDFINVVGSSTMPLMIFILPGYLYFAQTRKEELYSDKLRTVALLFAIAGALQILLYLSMSIFTFAVHRN